MQEVSMKEHSLQDFLFQIVGKGNAAVPVVRNIRDFVITSYEQDYRGYHNYTHIQDCLDKLEEVRGLIQYNRAVEMAIWYHDVVYVPASEINEQMSAEIAYNDCLRLGRNHNFATIVKNLIILSAHNPTKRIPDSLYMHDIDFSILGEGPDKYASYMIGIYREWQYARKDLQKKNRRHFLKRQLRKRRIFLTEYFRDKYEDATRDNIKKELAGNYDGVI